MTKSNAKNLHLKYRAIRRRDSATIESSPPLFRLVQLSNVQFCDTFTFEAVRAKVRILVHVKYALQSVAK